MLRLSFEIERAWSGRNFTLDFAEIERIDRKDDTCRWKMPGRCIDRTRRRILIFQKERAAIDDLTTETTAIAFATPVRLPTIENFIGKDFRQHISSNRPIGMFGIKKS